MCTLCAAAHVTLSAPAVAPPLACRVCGGDGVLPSWADAAGDAVFAGVPVEVVPGVAAHPACRELARSEVERCGGTSAGLGLDGWDPSSPADRALAGLPPLV